MNAHYQDAVQCLQAAISEAFELLSEKEIKLLTSRLSLIASSNRLFFFDAGYSLEELWKEILATVQLDTEIYETIVFDFVMNVTKGFVQRFATHTLGSGARVGLSNYELLCSDIAKAYSRLIDTSASIYAEDVISRVVTPDKVSVLEYTLSHNAWFLVLTLMLDNFSTLRNVEDGSQHIR